MLESIIRLPIGVLFGLLFVIIFIPAYFVAKKGSDRQKKLLQQQVLKRNGIIKKGGLFSYQSLCITLSGSEILIYSTPGRDNSPPHTHVSCDLNLAREYKIRVYREYRVFGIGTVFGQDVKLNNPTFDEAFVIQGNDETIVRELLTQEIQAKLVEIKANNPKFEINKKKFKLSIPEVPKDEQQYDQLIDTGLMLIKRVKEMG